MHRFDAIYFHKYFRRSTVAHLRAQTYTLPLIKTNSDLVKGIFEGTVMVFKGIPYAAPPVGPLRWRPPQPVTSREDVYHAKPYCPVYPQGLPEASKEKIPEDCLYLNSWLPAHTIMGGNLPVMVWMHGGGFTEGSGWDTAKEGMALADIKRQV